MRSGWWGDAVLAVAVTVVAVGGSEPAQRWQQTHRHLDVVGYTLLVIASLALVARRAVPVATLAVTLAATATYLVLGYGFGPILFSVAVGAYTVAAHLPVRRAAVASAVALPVLVAHAFVGPDRLDLAGIVPGSAWIVVPFAIGTAVRLGRESGARQREERARQVAYEERLRVAQEVHDVVGHGLAAITMQADVALHVLAKRPEQAVTALTAISQTSRAALDELRATLTLLRRDGDSRTAPSPGLAQLGGLAERVTRAGVPVTVREEVPPGQLPDAVQLAVYRIVQESLTNVLRHAGPATAAVSVRQVDGRLDVEVVDTGRGPVPGGQPPGHGIAGMRERAVALGGTLRAGPAAGGGFAVHAVLPIPSTAEVGAP